MTRDSGSLASGFWGEALMTTGSLGVSLTTTGSASSVEPRGSSLMRFCASSKMIVESCTHSAEDLPQRAASMENVEGCHALFQNNRTRRH